MRTLTFLFLLAPLLAQEQTPPATGSIQGHVIDSVSGIAIQRAEVRLLCLITVHNPPGCPKEEASIETQPDGHFAFENLTPGDYGVLAFAPGFLPGQVPSIHTKSNAVSTIDVRLDPEAKITGLVLTEDRKPVPGVEVFALEAKAGKLTQRAKATTNQSGAYSLADLAPGKYYVRVQPHPQVQDWIYYPSGFDLASATPLHLDPGQTQAGIAIGIRERQRFRVSGKIIWGSAPPVDATLKLSLSNREGQDVAAVVVKRSGESSSFDFQKIPAGHYTLKLVGSHFPPPAAGANVSVGWRRLMARDTVEITTHDIDDLVFRVPDPIKVTGQLAWDDKRSDADLHAPEITLSPAGEDRSIGSQKFAAIQKDGSFTVPDCEPIRYIVQLAPHPGSYVQSIVANGQDRTAAFLDLSSTSGMQLNIILHKGGGSLSGTVALPSPHPQVRLTLIPSNTLSDTSLEFPSAVVEKDGKFTLTAIHPGSYHAIATSYVGVPWNIPEVSQAIAARGPSVTIGDDAAGDVQLDLLPASEVSTIIEENTVH